ncbi:MAG TPA: hypothetical protein VFR09_04410, partial [Alphaproteobacteria bacterium]|nr:hypothetical protein [Alphaproteobacteria bacterium]
MQKLALTALLVLISSNAHANNGDFAGSVAIGSSYAGVVSAPTNGLAVQGVAAIGTSAPTSGTALDLGSNTSSLLLPIGTTGTRPGTATNGMLRYNTDTPAVEAYVNNVWATLGSGGGGGGSILASPPQGRLTLTSNTPVMTSDVIGANTIYYTDYVGDYVYNYVSSAWTANTIGGQLTLNLDENSGDTGYHQSGKIFDVFATLNGGSLVLCTGPAWSSDTSRGTGTGTTQISLQNGIWVNTNSMTCRFGNSSGNTLTAAVGAATYLGSFRTVSATATTLSAAVTTTTQTSISLTAPFRDAGVMANYYITIGSEDMLVTSGFGTTTLTVTRGQRGTTAATHTNGSAVSITPAQIAMQFSPTPQLLGTGNMMGLYNAYNRVPYTSIERDSTNSWTYSTATYRAINNSAMNSVHWLDGLQQSSATFTAMALGTVGPATAFYTVSIGLDSTIGNNLTSTFVASATST